MTNLRQAARSIWLASTEGDLADRWVRAIAVSAILLAGWWWAQDFVLPPLPRLLTATVAEIIFLGVFWYVGPLGYYVRWLRADRHIARRRASSK